MRAAFSYRAGHCSSSCYGCGLFSQSRVCVIGCVWGEKGIVKDNWKQTDLLDPEDSWTQNKTRSPSHMTCGFFPHRTETSVLWGKSSGNVPPRGNKQISHNGREKSNKQQNWLRQSSLKCWKTCEIYFWMYQRGEGYRRSLLQSHSDQQHTQQPTAITKGFMWIIQWYQWEIYRNAGVASQLRNWTKNQSLNWCLDLFPNLLSLITIYLDLPNIYLQQPDLTIHTCNH